MPYIYSWNKNSETARDLSRLLKFQRIKHENSKFRGGPNKVVINYGASELPPEVRKSRVIQSPEAIAINSHKLRFFQHMSEGIDNPRLPPWTTSADEVREWLVAGHPVMARQKLQGHSAEGLVVMTLDNPDGYVTAPLYTRYVKKKDEYRVHFMGNEIIDYTRKALHSRISRDDLTPEYFMVRNHEKGFVYVREGVQLPRDVEVQSRLAISKSGLDYGAVDVIFNSHSGKAYVLEINTAPGMEGTTLENYANAFQNYIKGMNR